MEFYWPASSGEWAAWVSALTTIGFGLLFLFAPHLSFRIIRITTGAGYHGRFLSRAWSVLHPVCAANALGGAWRVLGVHGIWSAGFHAVGQRQHALQLDFDCH